MISPTFAIMIWPLVALIFFNRFSPAVAVSLTLLGGYLLLPVRGGIDLPIVPALDKHSVPSLTALLVGAFILKAREKEFSPGSIQPGWLPKNKVILGLYLMTLGASFVTVFVNSDRLVYGPTVVSGLRPYDAFSLALFAFLQSLPLLLARKYLARPEDHRTLLAIFCIAGLLYTLPALVEVRLSPQINVWIYGFFAHEWQQHVRGGHFRPLVFLKHGLFLGIFFAAAVIAAAIYLRIDTVKRGKLIFALCWLILVLFLSRTLGAFLIALMLLPIALMLNVRMQMICVGVLAAIVLLYPMLRGADLVPTERALAIAESINPERAASLEYRFTNEDMLLEKANQRPVFGWGSWGRNRVYNEAGRDVAVTDGTWIIIIGSDGWVGYVGKFGLLTVPILMLAFSRRRKEVTLATSGLCLILMTNLLDMIPNSSLIPLTWMVGGALIGRLELHHSEAADGAPVPEVSSAHVGPRYSRSGPNSRPRQSHKVKPLYARSRRAALKDTGPMGSR